MSIDGYDNPHERDASALADMFVAYGLLFFFGATGVHRMYLGRWVTGFLYFFTLGFLGFGILYDVFMIPTMARQKNGFKR